MKKKRYEKFLEHWEDATLMSLTLPKEIPANFSPCMHADGGGGAGDACARQQQAKEKKEKKDEYLSLRRLDDSIAKWKERRIDEYAEQVA
jgi:hypothetical protein